MAKLLNNLQADGAVERIGPGWQRTSLPWAYDHHKARTITARRQDKLAELEDYVRTKDCRMEFLRRSLDDLTGQPCGICDNCTGSTLDVPLDPGMVSEAEDYLIQTENRITLEGHDGLAAVEGRFLSRQGAGGWGDLIAQDLASGEPFDDRLVWASSKLILYRWGPQPAPRWATAVLSQSHPDATEDFARRLSEAVGVPYIPTERAGLPAGPVLLISLGIPTRDTVIAIGMKLPPAAGTKTTHLFALTDREERLLL